MNDGALLAESDRPGLEQESCHRQIDRRTEYVCRILLIIARNFAGVRSDVVFRADHIATIPDVLAGIKALGYDPEKVKVVISSICDAASGWGAGKDVQAACEFRYARRIDR